MNLHHLFTKQKFIQFNTLKLLYKKIFFLFTKMNLHHLSTKEDNLHIHKTLGALCILHFIYRFYNLILYQNMKFNDNFIMIHLFLSATSLIFKISKRRHSKLPIIYPEMRLHTIVFTLRSILCFYIYPLHLRFLICIATNILADIVTYFLKNGTTIRNISFPEDIKNSQNMRIYYSSSQLGATLFMLGNKDMIFLPILPIQIAAFNMTMVKKGIISSRMSHAIYSWCLWVNYIPLLFDTNILIRMIVFKKLAEIFRFKINLNKYITWITIFSIYYSFEQYKFENLFYLNLALVGFGALKKAYEIMYDL